LPFLTHPDETVGQIAAFLLAQDHAASR
jgi:hypothetical protein